MLLGLAKTAEGVGASFSNLVGEVIADHWGYANAFIFLSVASLLPVALYSVFMPAGVVTEAQGDDLSRSVHDNMSVAGRYGGSLLAGHTNSHNESLATVEMRLRRSFGIKPEFATE